MNDAFDAGPIPPRNLPLAPDEMMREDEICEHLRKSGYSPMLIGRFLERYRPMAIVLGERVWDRQVTVPANLTAFRIEHERQVETQRLARQRQHDGAKAGSWVVPYSREPQPPADAAVARRGYREVRPVPPQSSMKPAPVVEPTPVTKPPAAVRPEMTAADRELVTLEQFVTRFNLTGNEAVRCLYQLDRRYGSGPRAKRGRLNLYWVGELKRAVLRSNSELRQVLERALEATGD